MKWKKYPILKLLLPYVLGIFVSYFCRLEWQNNHYALIISFFITLISCILYRFNFYRLRFFPTIGLVLAAFFCGIFSSDFSLPKKNFLSAEDSIKNDTFFNVLINEPPVEKEKSVKIIGKILLDSAKNDFVGRSIFYVQKDSAALSLQQGDLLLIHSHLQEIPKPKNPFVFDQQRYYQRKGIYYSSYLPADSWILLDHLRVNPIRSLSNHLQHSLSQVFAHLGLSGDEYSVITAILLGDDDSLDPELKSSYAAAGVSHILCVSGMHVGIIFLIISFLLKPLDWAPALRYLKAVLLVLCIWLYANITGLAPSVTRTATMFTFVVVGRMLRRPVDIFHSLFASMFLLLLINPMLLFEIGFEMSYLAVFGIVIFQPKFLALLHPRNKLLCYLWELVTVSVSAQLVTFPLSIFYFGQFPNYFLLTNLSVISLSFAVVVTGVILLSISWIPVISGFAVWILTWEIRLLNGIVRGVESLPGAVTENLSITGFQLIMLYALIVLAYFWCVRKEAVYRYALLVGVWVLSIFRLFEIQSQISTQAVTVYSIEKMSAIGARQGNQSILLLDSLARNSRYGYAFNIHPHLRHQHIVSKQIDFDSVYLETPFAAKYGDIMNLCGHTFFILQGGKWLYPGTKNLHVDYLYLKDNPKIPLSKLKNIIDFEKVIVDGTNSMYWEERWRDSCKLKRIPFYSVRTEGYLEVTNDF